MGASAAAPTWPLLLALGLHSMACQRKPKVVFTAKEREVLEKAYDAGMNSVSKEKVSLIQEAAARIQKDEQEIKNWIGNEKGRRKRSGLSGTDAPSTKKPPQKLRAPNPYNLFVKDFFKSKEGIAIPDLGDKNKAAAIKWRAMSQEDKQPFFQLASQIPAVSPSASSSAYNTWHETQRILSNFQDNCEWAENFGIHVMYIVCNEKNHYVGGTKAGREFLSTNPHLPASFLISTKPGITPTPPDPISKKEFRAAVQEQLNAKYSLAVGDPHARVPYQQLRPEHIIGLPPGINLCHPSNLSNDQLETIYNNIAHIKFIGVPPKPIQSSSEHNYTKQLNDSVPPRQRAGHGYTTLTTKGGGDEHVKLDHDQKTDHELKIGHSVHLLSTNYDIVGTAVTMSGNLLHGHSIPEGFTKVSVQRIEQGRKPWPSVKGLDDEELANGSITAWPMKFMRKV